MRYPRGHWYALSCTTTEITTWHLVKLHNPPKGCDKKVGHLENWMQKRDETEIGLHMSNFWVELWSKQDSSECITFCALKENIDDENVMRWLFFITLHPKSNRNILLNSYFCRYFICVWRWPMFVYNMSHIRSTNILTKICAEPIPRWILSLMNVFLI